MRANGRIHAMKFFLYFSRFSFLFSASVRAEPVCPNYTVVSPLHQEPQEESDSCTFAASRVVTTHYGSSRSQCQLVGRVVGRDCCLSDVFDDACHPDPPKWPSDVFNKHKLLYSTLRYLVSSPTGPPRFTEIVDEVCNHNRPIVSVASQLVYPDGPLLSPWWHAVVVDGYRQV